LASPQASSEEAYIKAFAHTQDGTWYGEKTAKLADVRNDSVGTHYIFDITVYEQSQPTETFSKPLVPGWNLVSLPLIPDDNSISAVLTSISEQYTAAMVYNAAINQFEDVTTMDPGVGYFIYMGAAGTWTYDGVAYDSMNVPISEDLNLIGWVNESVSLPDALNSIAGNYNYVARWNTAENKFEVYVPGVPAELNGFATIESGVGYYIAATADCTLMCP